MFFDLNRPKRFIENMPEDFKMPHRIYGKIAEQLMIERYGRLHNKSVGLKTRLVGTVYGQATRN